MEQMNHSQTLHSFYYIYIYYICMFHNKTRKTHTRAFKYDNTEMRHMAGGGKVLRRVKIHGNKGYKSVSNKRFGKK